MQIKLIKCPICDMWYSPVAHSGHCPYCGAMKIGRKYYVEAENKLRQINRVIPRVGLTVRPKPMARVFHGGLV